jgi:hypothetical protein
MADNRKNNGGARRGAGRKKGSTSLTVKIQQHCYDFMKEVLMDEAIRLKAVKQLSLTLDTEQEDYLYIIENNGMYKIGYSSNWDKRLKAYKTHMGSVNLVYVTKQIDCFDLENYLHGLFIDKRVNGEWFELDEDDLFEAIKYCSNKLE